MGFSVTIDSGGATWHRKLKHCARADNLLAGAQQQFPFLGSDPCLGIQLVEKFLESVDEAYRFMREKLSGEIGDGEIGDDVDGVSKVTWREDVWNLSQLRGATNLLGVQLVKENAESQPQPRLCIYFRSQGAYPPGSDMQAGSLKITLESFTERECLDFMLSVAGHAGWGSLREYSCHFAGDDTEYEGPFGEVLTALFISETPRSFAASRAPHRESLG